MRFDIKVEKVNKLGHVRDHVPKHKHNKGGWLWPEFRVFR